MNQLFLAGSHVNIERFLQGNSDFLTPVAQTFSKTILAQLCSN